LFTVTANPGFEIAAVTAGGAPETIINPNSFTFNVPNVTADIIVTATFGNIPDFIVAPETGWNLANNVFTFTQNGAYEISMRTGVATTTQRIAVAAGLTDVNITLDGVKIENPVGGSPLTLNPGASVTLTLADGTTNTFATGDFLCGHTDHWCNADNRRNR
jgi:hypothetical protein